MSVDELQKMLDERFPHGAHVWTRRKGPESVYITPRVIVVNSHLVEIPPVDSERSVEVIFDLVPTIQDGMDVMFSSESEGDVVLSDTNSTPEIERQRKDLYGSWYLQMVRGEL